MPIGSQITLACVALDSQASVTLLGYIDEVGTLWQCLGLSG